jgi:hypothetical protein
MILCLSACQAWAGADGYTGRWALHLPGGAGWLEVRQESGYLDAEILWRGGSVVPVSAIYLEADSLVVERTRSVVRKRDDQGKPTRTHTLVQRILLEREGEDRLQGTSVTPQGNGLGVDRVSFEATRIPALPPAPNLKKLRYGDAIELFNGRDLSGWQVMNPRAGNGWAVKDGVLINDPASIGKQHTSNIRTEKTFEDFRLTLELNVPKGSNSGIYLRGIYEVQIMDSYGRDLDSHHLGAIYSRITPSEAAEKPAGQWQAMDMILCDRHVTVVLNGKTIIDNQPLYGVTGGALTADEFKPGPIYLQGDHGPVSFRNIVLQPILK